MELLRNEIGKCLRIVPDNYTEIEKDTGHEKVNFVKLLEKPRVHAAENWSEATVKEWFIRNSIDLAILENFLPCSGIVLKQVYDMNRRAPEFFYYSLEKIKGVNIAKISLFTHFLVKLFEENV